MSRIGHDLSVARIALGQTNHGGGVGVDLGFHDAEEARLNWAVRVPGCIGILAVHAVMQAPHLCVEVGHPGAGVSHKASQPRAQGYGAVGESAVVED